jgi:hypothetical protein
MRSSQLNGEVAECRRIDAHVSQQSFNEREVAFASSRNPMAKLTDRRAT